MKWTEMSVFHKVVFVSTCVASLALLVVCLYSFCGVLPGLYENPLYITLLGFIWIGQAILTWEKQRVLAIFNLITALICLCGALLWIVLMLMNR